MMVTIDPTNHYPPNRQGPLIEACGLIPIFFCKAIASLSEKATAREVYEAMVEMYGYGDYHTTKWGHCTKEGIYKSSYPEDPDLYPYIEMRLPDGLGLFVYPHALLAVVDTKETILSRMD